MRRDRWGLTALLAGLLLVAACGGDDGDETSPGSSGDTTTTQSDDGSTTTAAPTPEEEGVAAYEAAQAFYTQAYAEQPPNPENPAVFDHFGGEAATDVIRNLLTAQQDNQYWESELTLRPDVASATANKVILTDCATESYRKVDIATGAVADEGTQDYNLRVEVTNEPDGWRVTTMDNQEEPCEPSEG